MQLFVLFRMLGIQAERTRLPPHRSRDLDLLETFRRAPDLLTTCQRSLSARRLDSAELRFVFAARASSEAIFLGTWRVLGCVERADWSQEQHRLIDEHPFPASWHQEAEVCYALEQTELMSELSQRLIIDWGRSAVAWVQTLDKPS